MHSGFAGVRQILFDACSKKSARKANHRKGCRWQDFTHLPCRTKKDLIKIIPEAYKKRWIEETGFHSIKAVLGKTCSSYVAVYRPPHMGHDLFSRCRLPHMAQVVISMSMYRLRMYGMRSPTTTDIDTPTNT